MTSSQTVSEKILSSASIDKQITNDHSVSVVTVCLNARDELQKTIDSILSQDYPQIEYLIVDGGSTDGTLEIIRANAERIDYWHSKPDLGVYYAMNLCSDALLGRWSIMNAGDTFSAHDSLSRMFRTAPDEADVVYGHHLYVNDGKEEYHPAADFESRLGGGCRKVNWDMIGSPAFLGHQATAVRKTLLERLKFDTIFWYRCRS